VQLPPKTFGGLLPIEREALDPSIKGWPLALNAGCARVFIFPFAMSASAEPNSTPNPDIQVPMPDVVKFMRQFGHDLRNHLNAAELQAAYIAEILEDPELKNEVKRLRAMISSVGTSLQNVTSALSAARLTPMPYGAADLLEDLRQKLVADYPDEGAKIEWSVQVGDATLQIDPQSLQPALMELFANAFRHDRAEGVISVEARIEGDRFVCTIREPKRGFERSTDNWGREPLRSIGQGHYGLGLHRSRAIIEAHRGQLNARYDSPASFLITTVVLPLAAPTG
jgi:K+-sensing histidine kinase KdpD